VGAKIWVMDPAVNTPVNSIPLPDYILDVVRSIAFAQVADSLRSREHDAELVHNQSRALSASEEASRLIQANYEAGTANDVQVLIANIQYQQAKIGYIQAQSQRF
jgi:outer membrane protein TolC